MSELSIILTNKCNLDCDYCFSRGEKYKDFDKNKISLLDKYNLIEYNDINVLGGEIGLLSKEELDIVFNYLKNRNIFNINIFTNGLFLERYYNYYKDFNYIYHVVNSNFKKYNIENIEYIFIINNTKSIDIINDIALNNKDIKFNIQIDLYFYKFDNDFCDSFLNLLNNDNIRMFDPYAGDIEKILKKKSKNIFNYLKVANRLFKSYEDKNLTDVFLY
jgi:molybdenum cofactor biosynthesis enzyme MoaA